MVPLSLVPTALARARVLYAAVRRQRGTVTAIEVVAGSAWALLWATVRAAGRPRMRNAVRHFAWSAWLTAAFGADLARAVGEAQEHGSGRPQDSAVDRRNNQVGREYAGRCRVGGPAPYALWRLAGAGVTAWRAGELWMVDDGRVVASPRG